MGGEEEEEEEEEKIGVGEVSSNPV